MRNISFALTTEQIRNCTKTVTRRIGWRFLKPGTLLQPVVKAQGIKKGKHVEKIGGPIRVERVSVEWMSDFRNRPDAQAECRREGFPEMTPQEFYAFFRQSHRDPSADDLLATRIEFSYIEHRTLVDQEVDPNWPTEDVMSEIRLRDPLEMINSVSRLKLKADPTRAMVDIAVIAKRCMRYHPTLALSTWREAIRTIREALEGIEDIYDSAEEP